MGSYCGKELEEEKPVPEETEKRVDESKVLRSRPELPTSPTPEHDQELWKLFRGDITEISSDNVWRRTVGFVLYFDGQKLEMLSDGPEAIYRTVGKRQRAEYVDSADAKEDVNGPPGQLIICREFTPCKIERTDITRVVRMSFDGPTEHIYAAPFMIRGRSDLSQLAPPRRRDPPMIQLAYYYRIGGQDSENCGLFGSDRERDFYRNILQDLGHYFNIHSPSVFLAGYIRDLINIAFGHTKEPKWNPVSTTERAMLAIFGHENPDLAIGDQNTANMYVFAAQCRAGKCEWADQCLSVLEDYKSVEDIGRGLWVLGFAESHLTSEQKERGRAVISKHYPTLERGLEEDNDSSKTWALLGIVAAERFSGNSFNVLPYLRDWSHRQKQRKDGRLTDEWETTLPLVLLCVQSYLILEAPLE